MKYFTIFCLSIVFLICPFAPVLAQTQEPDTTFSVSIERLEIIPFSFVDTLQLIVAGYDQKKLIIPEPPQVVKTELSEEDKTVLSRIADIYRLHVLSLEAQIKSDALSTEKYITSAISEMQNMLEENPEVQQHKRFAELYRTVITEYREFYGTSDSGLEEEGEIFGILNEMFSEDELDADADNFAIPSLLANSKKFQVPLVQNRYVNNQLAYLWIRRPEIMELWLQRKEKYFPMIEKIFEEENVPKELMHLAMIESGLNPSAKSKAAAVGMWQFIKATGSYYGLEVNWWVDERRDPVKATRAAARHLNDLYKVWGDWHLALANYNVSPRRLKQAIRQSDGVRDYWVIYPYLPKETRGYVPSFIATTMIASSPEEFGFKSRYGEKPFQFETVDISGSYDLSVLAQAAGISLDEIKEFNTALIRNATPPGKSAYPLRLPVGTKETFLANFKDVPESNKANELFVHKVKKGETIGKIAHRYGVSVRDIYDSNDKISKSLKAGQEIIIPVPAGKTTAILADRPSNASENSGSTAGAKTSAKKVQVKQVPENSTRVVHTVKAGDTIGQIAEKYKTSISNIQRWNNVKKVIRVGQKLEIYVPNKDVDQYASASERKTNQSKTSANDGYVTYKVKSNDSLYEIASNNGVSVEQIKQLNNLRRNTIYPGQVLKLKAK